MAPSTHHARMEVRHGRIGQSTSIRTSNGLENLVRDGSGSLVLGQGVGVVEGVVYRSELVSCKTLNQVISSFFNSGTFFSPFFFVHSLCLVLCIFPSFSSFPRWSSLGSSKVTGAMTLAEQAGRKPTKPRASIFKLTGRNDSDVTITYQPPGSEVEPGWSQPL